MTIELTGIYKTHYELKSINNVQITKPDGKVFYIPLKDMEDFLIETMPYRTPKEKLSFGMRMRNKTMKVFGIET